MHRGSLAAVFFIHFLVHCSDSVKQSNFRRTNFGKFILFKDIFLIWLTDTPIWCSLFRKCDRFWYETGNHVLKFSEDQLTELRRTSLAGLICRNMDDNSLLPRYYRIQGNILFVSFILHHILYFFWDHCIFVDVN